jgi:hypothetical protein
MIELLDQLTDSLAADVVDAIAGDFTYSRPGGGRRPHNPPPTTIRFVEVLGRR